MYTGHCEASAVTLLCWMYVGCNEVFGRIKTAPFEDTGICYNVVPVI